ncbi:hypothetical protein [Shewanella algae]|uniref:hypothetical protein n=1 Tax=Shewanella algae TaxID=38313 RepID=UPI00313CAF09
MLTQVVSDNLADVMQKHQLRPSNIVDIAESIGADLNKTFMSRVLKGDHDFLMSKIDSLLSVLRTIEPGLQDHELFIPGIFRKERETRLTVEQLNHIASSMIIDLIDLNWVEIKEGVPVSVIGDYMASQLKKSMPDSIVEKDAVKEKAAAF